MNFTVQFYNWLIIPFTILLKKFLITKVFNNKKIKNKLLILI